MTVLQQKLQQLLALAAAYLERKRVRGVVDNASNGRLGKCQRHRLAIFR